SGMAIDIVVSLRIATNAATRRSQITRMPRGSIVGTACVCGARTLPVSVVVKKRSISVKIDRSGSGRRRIPRERTFQLNGGTVLRIPAQTGNSPVRHNPTAPRRTYARGVSMGRPMGAGRGARPIDEAAQRRRNAEAPRVPDLGRRVVRLFAPYRGRIALTALLVVVGAGLGVVPPLVIQRVFDEALFPASGGVQLGLLAGLVVLMIALYVAAAVLQIVPTWLMSSAGNRVTGDLRIRMFDHLQSMEL